MPYKLKDNVADFEVVDGPFTGRRFVSGEIYAEIPPNEEKKFEPVKTESDQAEQAGKTTKRPAESLKTGVTDA